MKTDGPMRDLVELCDRHGRAVMADRMVRLLHRWALQGVAMADAAAQGRTPPAPPQQGKVVAPPDTTPVGDAVRNQMARMTGSKGEGDGKDGGGQGLPAKADWHRAR